MPPTGIPRSRPLAGEPGVPVAPTASTGVASSETAAGLTAEVRFAQCCGTESIPTRAACPAPAETAPTCPTPPPRLPRPRFANCGVGNQAPPAPAVLPPGPKVNCCAIEELNCAIPFEK